MPVPSLSIAKPDAEIAKTIAAETASAPPAATSAEPQAPSAKPTRPERAKRRDTGTSLLAVTAISFSLTFVGVSVALLLGLLPPAFASLQAPVDLGVVLLIVPLCALVLAMMAEALRAAMKGTPSPHVSRATVALNTWRPGHGEG